LAGAPAAGARQGTVFSPAERAEAAQHFAALDRAADRLEQHIDETTRDAGIPTLPAAGEPESPLAEMPAATESGDAEPWNGGADEYSDHPMPEIHRRALESRRPRAAGNDDAEIVPDPQWLLRDPRQQAEAAGQYAQFIDAADAIERYVDRTAWSADIALPPTDPAPSSLSPSPGGSDGVGPGRDPPGIDARRLTAGRVSLRGLLRSDPRSFAAPASTSAAPDDPDQFAYEGGAVPTAVAQRALEGLGRADVDIYRGIQDAQRQILGGTTDFFNNLVHFADDIVRYGEDHGLPNVYFQLLDNEGNWAPRIMSTAEFREAQRRGETDILQVPTTGGPDCVTGAVIRTGTTFALGRGTLAMGGGMASRVGAGFVSGVLMDPSQERLSNVIGWIAPNFLTEWLKADPGEQDQLLARLKSGLEFAGLDAAGAGVAALLSKARALLPSGGTPDQLAALIDQLQNSRGRKVYTEAEARALTGPNRGLIFVAEKPRGPAAAQEFQAGTSGAFSDIATRKLGSPALRYDNPNPRGVNYVKFDAPSVEPGPRGLTLLLIDAKTKPAIFNEGSQRDTIATLRRVKMALQQNPGFKVVYEYPTQELADRAKDFIKLKGFGDVITTRARPQ
jgi:hypothetical protein